MSQEKKFVEPSFLVESEEREEGEVVFHLLGGKYVFVPLRQEKSQTQSPWKDAIVLTKEKFKEEDLPLSQQETELCLDFDRPPLGAVLFPTFVYGMMFYRKLPVSAGIAVGVALTALSYSFTKASHTKATAIQLLSKTEEKSLLHTLYCTYLSQLDPHNPYLSLSPYGEQLLSPSPSPSSPSSPRSFRSKMRSHSPFLPRSSPSSPSPSPSPSSSSLEESENFQQEPVNRVRERRREEEGTRGEGERKRQPYMYDLFGQSGRFDYFNHKRVEIAGETKEEESTEEQEQEGSIPFFLNEGSQEEKGEKEENEMNKRREENAPRGRTPFSFDSWQWQGPPRKQQRDK